METVTIDFLVARGVRECGKSYYLDADGESTLQLPISETELDWVDTPDGRLVTAVTVPRFIAEDRGLIQPESTVQEETCGSMSRSDWFLLGGTMAALIRGENEREAIWIGRRVAAVLTEDER